MKRTLVMFLIILSAEMILGVPHAICPNQTIEAGQNISLTAYLDLPVDLSAYTVVWKRDDLNKDCVHAYRGKLDLPREQSAQYRGRTTLDPEDLTRGNLTLWIFSAQPSDSGRYKVYIPKLLVGCIIDLYVEDKQNDTKRNDFSPTIPPDDRDAANMEAVRHIVIPSVVVGAAIAVGGLIVFLVKSGKISKDCQEDARSRDDANRL
ncbi:butyrophilin-like protein 2 isoform X2 [Larimichthys crocea]|uniref:butyrophilin-like protein 2 isoform X2 n=1 Tax=Larimichthys crocea TaxID=215358 RepID=UPI000F5DE21D|nr:butyrophilin-like protein 2 isoform X2 [Larimichthys crocea]